MKVYISGKITGLDLNDARALFAEAAEEVRLMGHEPMNPMELTPGSTDWVWEDYMIKDIKILFGCEGIYMMRNWQDSKGARIEHHIALETGKGIMYQGAVMSGRDFAECVRVVRGRYPDAMCMQKQDGLYVVFADGCLKDAIGCGRTAPRAWNEAANEVEARVIDEKYREEPFVIRVVPKPGEPVKVLTGFGFDN